MSTRKARVVRMAAIDTHVVWMYTYMCNAMSWTILPGEAQALSAYQDKLGNEEVHKVQRELGDLISIL